jgi:signal transduction histidine kinase
VGLCEKIARAANRSQPDMTDRTQTSPLTSTDHALWLPFALIAFALILMLTAPLIIGTRVQRIRQHEGNIIAPALIRVNDLEAAIGNETASRSEQAEKTADSVDARRSADLAIANAASDIATLDSLVRQSGPDAIVLMANARIGIDEWRLSENRFGFAADGAASKGVAEGSATRSRRWRSVQTALSSVERLDDNLGNESRTELAEISRLERFNDFVPLLLVPLALIGLAALGWTARRTRQLSREASAGRAAAEQALTAKSTLMRGVTHDLKNPLGAAKGYVELITTGVFGPVAKAQSDIMQRLQNLIDITLDTLNDLVEISRADEGILTVDAQDTDIVALTHEIVDDYRPIGMKAGVVVTLEIEGEIETHPIVVTDSSRVRQVMSNLLSNAFKYASPGHSAGVTLMHVDDSLLKRCVAIQVSDNGPGIPAELHEKVFEEFFRVPSSSQHADGTGVGLAIARRIARLLGGDLRLSDTAGGGATFTLLLPVRLTAKTR